MTNASHPPRPGVRRYVMESYLDTKERRREMAAAIWAVNACGLAAEVTVSDLVGRDEPRYTLHATRRERTRRDER